MILTRSAEDFKWFNENYSDIEKEYSGQFIAIKDKKVLDSAKLFLTLLNKIKSKKVNTDELLIKKVVPKGEILIY